MYRRIFADVILFLTVIFSPFWLWLILAILGAFYFASYYEIIFAFLLSDLIYGLSLNRFRGTHFAGLIAGTVIFLIIFLLKRKILAIESGLSFKKYDKKIF
jgi:hypothetical protein